MASSRCYTRRIGRDSPNLPGRGKWTSTSPAPTSCVIGLKPRTSTAKPTTCTAECGPGQHSASSCATMGNVSQRRATLVFPASIGSVVTTTRCFLREHTFGTRETMGYGGLEKSARALPRAKVYLARFLDDPGPIKLPLPRRATPLRREPCESLGACKFTSPARFLGDPT